MYLLLFHKINGKSLICPEYHHVFHDNSIKTLNLPSSQCRSHLSNDSDIEDKYLHSRESSLQQCKLQAQGDSLVGRGRRRWPWPVALLVARWGRRGCGVCKGDDRRCAGLGRLLLTYDALLYLHLGRCSWFIRLGLF